ncbi:hypothetical protein CDAR_309041 [Caerostris darwini]|uniref:Uncharacterized protein n=1 Tax=Caerostris darwini TaxID=1538125 RepID=A0AAV4S8Q2_9ARAC|nr:hypothetical protein CDAR_309041 [Caerostris darwini]
MSLHFELKWGRPVRVMLGTPISFYIQRKFSLRCITWIGDIVCSSLFLEICKGITEILTRIDFKRINPLDRVQCDVLIPNCRRTMHNVFSPQILNSGAAGLRSYMET